MAIGFTGSPLLRLDHERSDVAAVARHREDPRALVLLLDGLDPITDTAGGLSWSPIAECDPAAELALLGMLEQRPAFVALPPDARGKPAFALFRVLAGLPGPDAAIWGAARGLVDWHARHRFCGRCGVMTEVTRAGWCRRCPSCAAEHFPRTDPVVIMLAEHAGRVLVGRQPRYPPGRYSALAGFIEVGESVEEAVARELFEEAGVRATAVRYVASQPWPLPGSQLMLACVAAVDGDVLTLDHEELEHAMWVDREGVRMALASAPGAPFLAPPAYAIAHTLLAWWADQA